MVFEKFLMALVAFKWFNIAESGSNVKIFRGFSLVFTGNGLHVLCC